MASRATDAGSPVDRPGHNPQQPISPLTSDEQPAPPHALTRPSSTIDLEPLKQLGIFPTLIAGWSAFPAFMLLLTTSLNFLYAHFAPFLLMIETEPQSIESFAAITVRVLLLLFYCRNAIAFSWDMFVDSVRQRPTLNPLLFRNCRDASRALGCKRFPTRLMVLLHLTSAVALAGSLRLASRFGIVDLGPVGGPEICWLFLLLNFIGKVWCFYRLTPCCGKGLGSKLSCLYMSCSEAVLLLLMLAPDLSRVAISTTGDHHHAYPWVEMSRDGQRQILTLNFFILVLTNVAPFCLFSALVCKMGMKALEEPPAWQAVVEPCRALSMAIVAIGWALSLYTTGLSPSLFSLCLLITGASMNRFLLFLIVEGIRLGAAVWALTKARVGRIRDLLSAAYWGVTPSIDAVWACTPLALGLLILLHVSTAHSWGAVRTCLGLALGIRLNFIYKYYVQATRSRRRTFFQHGIDVGIFLPLLLILTVALPKSLHRRSTLAQGIPPPPFPPPPVFHVIEGPESLTISSIMGNLELTHVKGSAATDTALSTSNIDRPLFHRYAFCDVEIQGASLLDYALLSLLSYFDKDSPDFKVLFQTIAASDDWVVRDEDLWATAAEAAGTAVEEESPAPGPTGMPRARALEFFSARRNLSVIAVAGTNPLRPYDVFQDVLLFHRAFTYEIASILSPPLKWIPRQWKSYILSLSSVPLYLTGKSSPHLFYHHTLIEAVKTCKERRHMHKVVLTGHSLGGAIAKVVAAGSNIPVVAISSPGVFLSSRGFGIDQDPLKYIAINLINDGDIMPKLDRLTGAVFHLGCGSSNPFRCHQPGQTICELLSHCGGSKAFSKCRFYTSAAK